MLPAEPKIYGTLSDDFFFDTSCALARLRLGTAARADTEWLFRFFTMDQLIDQDMTEVRKNMTDTDRSAAMLLLIKAEKRTLPHDRLNALQDTCNKAILRISDACTSDETFVRLQKEALEAAPAYHDALAEALRSQRRRVETEIAQWALKTSPPHPYSVIATDCAKARIAVSQILLGTTCRPFSSLERFLAKTYLCCKEMEFVREGRDFLVMLIASAWASIKTEKAYREDRAVLPADLEPAGVCELFIGTAAAAQLLARVDANDYSYAEQQLRETPLKVLNEIVGEAKDLSGELIKPEFSISGES